MTRVRLVGKDDVDLRYELVSSETSREALATYEFLPSPIENAVELETPSLGAALALLNDLNWYTVMYTERVEVLEPSVSEEEWLSRDLAHHIYEDRVSPDETREFFAVRGVADGEVLEPLYTRDEPGTYDLHDAEIDETIVTRITEEEF
jgi:hypothetical protein